MRDGPLNVAQELPMPRLQVTAGSSFDALQPVNVNRDEDPLEISNGLFEGKLTVRIKDFKGADGQVIPDTTSGYFAEHSGLTWSIQIAGRFKEDVQLDDVVFGVSCSSNAAMHKLMSCEECL